VKLNEISCDILRAISWDLAPLWLEKQSVDYYYFYVDM